MPVKELEYRDVSKRSKILDASKRTGVKLQTPVKILIQALSSRKQCWNM